MCRNLRKSSPTGFYHWISRGIHKKVIFHQNEDVQVFLGLLNEYRCKNDVSVHHYCVMANHAHALLYSEEVSNISSLSRDLQRRYALYYCGKYKRIGRVFQDRYKLLTIDDEDYLLSCARYIERNPVKAKLVKLAEDYPYSSFRTYQTGDDAHGLIEPTDTYLGLSESDLERVGWYSEYVNTSPDEEDEALQRILVE